MGSSVCRQSLLDVVLVGWAASATRSSLGRSRLWWRLDLAPRGVAQVKSIFVLIMIAGLAWFGYGKFKSSASSDPTGLVASKAAPIASSSSELADAASSSFSCDGRTMCPQMTSCAEATYFIQHCPGTKMDGNNDGVPCERQWCN
jgi:hypothetical protein